MPLVIRAAIPTEVPLAVSGVLAQVQEASVRSLGTWGRTPGGIGVRFTPAAFGLYALARRSASYEGRHPEPYVASGAFRLAVLSGTGTRVATVGQGDGFRTTMTSPAARGLNFRRNGGIYADQWARLHPLEGTAIDQAVQTGLTSIEVDRG